MPGDHRCSASHHVCIALPIALPTECAAKICANAPICPFLGRFSAFRTISRGNLHPMSTEWHRTARFLFSRFCYLFLCSSPFFSSFSWPSGFVVWGGGERRWVRLLSVERASGVAPILIAANGRSSVRFPCRLIVVCIVGYAFLSYLSFSFCIFFFSLSFFVSLSPFPLSLTAVSYHRARLPLSAGL